MLGICIYRNKNYVKTNKVFGLIIIGRKKNDANQTNNVELKLKWIPWLGHINKIESNGMDTEMTDNLH